MQENYPLVDLTGFQRELLAVIADLDSPKGLAVKQQLEEYHSKQLHHGRLYPNLDTLVDKGLVKKGTKDRRTNSYEITKRGQRELNAHAHWFIQKVATESKEIATAD
jgi:DNA-binding PadR family transcriptional regulator